MANDKAEAAVPDKTDRIRVRYDFTVVLRNKVSGVTPNIESELTQVLRIINHGLEQIGFRFLDVDSAEYVLKAEFPKPPKKPVERRRQRGRK